VFLLPGWCRLVGELVGCWAAECLLANLLEWDIGEVGEKLLPLKNQLILGAGRGG